MISEQRWPADPASVPEARLHAVQTLTDVIPDRLDELELMVSELVTNAIVHAQTAFTVRIITSEHAVLVEVSDQTPGTVRAHSADPHEPHGRGLHIVQTLADRWGVRDTRSSTGKTVWFALNDGHRRNRHRSGSAG